ncbi:MAG: hypothetical protein ACLFPS_05895 [Clostridia bacterium]
MFDDVLESTGFWVLGIGGISTELLGWILSRRAGWVTLPFWQLGIMMVVTLIAAAYFGTQD